MNSKYCETLFRVPQDSILGLLLFSAYICDMFYDVNDGNIASNGDYNSSNLSPVINKLKENTSNLFQWSRNNHMKTNAD